jgi:hypothetical protein
VPGDHYDNILQEAFNIGAVFENPVQLSDIEEKADVFHEKYSLPGKGCKNKKATIPCFGNSSIFARNVNDLASLP